MQKLSSTELRTQLKEARKRVQHTGEIIEITVYGQTVGCLVPLAVAESFSPRRTQNAGIIEFRDNFATFYDRLQSGQMDCLYLLHHFQPVMAFIAA